MLSMWGVANDFDRTVLTQVCVIKLYTKLLKYLY